MVCWSCFSLRLTLILGGLLELFFFYFCTVVSVVVCCLLIGHTMSQAGLQNVQSLPLVVIIMDGIWYVACGSLTGQLYVKENPGQMHFSKRILAFSA